MDNPWQLNAGIRVLDIDICVHHKSDEIACFDIVCSKSTLLFCAHPMVITGTYRHSDKFHECHVTKLEECRHW